jgi:hypothetical protein
MYNDMEELIKRFLKKIPLHSPFKIDQSIALKIADCIFEVIKKKEKVEVNRISNYENRLVLQFNDSESFQYLFTSNDIEDYGNRLVNLAIQGKIIMEIGPFENPMKYGFHRFIGYRKKIKGLELYQCIIPLF